jgi:hypothetical protein
VFGFLFISILWNGGTPIKSFCHILIYLILKLNDLYFVKLSYVIHFVNQFEFIQ